MCVKSLLNRIIFCFSLMLLGGLSAFAQEYVEVPKWRIALQGGYGRRIGEYQATGNEVEDTHNKRLFGGLHYGADLTYYLSNSYGIGLKYSNLHTTSKDAVITSDGRSGMYSDAMDIMFVGPMLATRSVNASGKGIFMFSYGFGYLSYDDSGRLIDDKVSVTAGTLGACLELGYDFKVTKNMFLGANLGAIGGTLSSCTVTTNGHPEKYTLDKDERESLLHVYLDLGIRYYF